MNRILGILKVQSSVLRSCLQTDLESLETSALSFSAILAYHTAFEITGVVHSKCAEAIKRRIRRNDLEEDVGNYRECGGGYRDRYFDRRVLADR